MNSLQLRPALRLLTHWAPTRAATADRGRLSPPHERSWSESPDPADFAALVPGRIPLTVEILNHEIDPDDDDFDDDEFDLDDETTARPRAEVAANVEALLLAHYPGELPEPARELLTQIALEYSDGDLARLTVAAQPDGPPLEELHLVYREYDGGTITLSFTAPAADPAEPDPARILTDVADVLGGYVWLNNNDRLDVTIETAHHGLPTVDDTTFRAWCPTSKASATLVTDLPDTRPGTGLLDADALAAFRASFTEHNLMYARSGAWASEYLDDLDVDDPKADFPGKRLVGLFTAELFDRAAALAGGPLLVYGLGLEPSEYGLTATVLFVGPDHVVALEISASV